VKAADALAAKGIAAAVVSLPSFELFRKQDAAYRKAVLGSAPRIGIEAAVEQGWREWLRPEDVFVGMSDFGASAPAGKLFPHFGITPERVAELAQKLVG
jgi:transketolase